MKIRRLPAIQIHDQGSPHDGLIYKDLWLVTDAPGREGLYAKHAGFTNGDVIPKAMLN